MSEPLEDLAAQLFTREMRDEFSISRADTDVPGWIRFRLDPGDAFERYGYVRPGTSGDARLELFQRYQPDSDLAWLGHRDIGRSVTWDLRSLVNQANSQETRPHWRRDYRPAEPEWTRVIPVTARSDAADAPKAVTGHARSTGVAHFLWHSPEGLVCGNGALGSSVVLSVNPLGEWALHHGPDTLPFKGEPDLTGLVPEPRTAARLAALDAGHGRGTEIRSEYQEPGPAAGPAPRPPARGRGPS